MFEVFVVPVASNSMALLPAWRDCNAAGVSVDAAAAAAAGVVEMVGLCAPVTPAIGRSCLRGCCEGTPRGCKKPIGALQVKRTFALIPEECRAASEVPVACRVATYTAVHVATNVVDAGARGAGRTVSASGDSGWVRVRVCGSTQATRARIGA